jgi:uncharacterized protein YbcI
LADCESARIDERLADEETHRRPDEEQSLLDEAEQREANSMTQSESTKIEELARVATDFQTELTGHAPRAVSVVLSDDTLVIRLHEALTPAEKALAGSPAGAAKIQDFHRQLFASSADALEREIKRITGRDVCESAAEMQPGTGAVVHAFTTGTIVQIFDLSHRRAA